MTGSDTVSREIEIIEAARSPSEEPIGVQHVCRIAASRSFSGTSVSPFGETLRRGKAAMDRHSFTVEAVAYVIGGRADLSDDYWGGSRAIVRVDDYRFGVDSVEGISSFSHLEIVFLFHLMAAETHIAGSRRPREDPRFPRVGIFSQRNARRPNLLGVSRCRLLRVDGLDLHVEGLDAVDGTPVLDIKPWYREFGPDGQTRQAAWTGVMLSNYYAAARPSPGD